MITKLSVYQSLGTDPYHNIATEKYLLETVDKDTCILYLWQNQNTVVIGRNQNAWAECRTTLLGQEGGKLARRLSGGGAVFHDLGNLNFTFLVAEENYDLDKQLRVIETACGLIGIPVSRSGRNDLLADGSKFSGNAFYHTQNNAYHHGTLLINADMEKLSRYLTPSKAKLEAKGVQSVRSRVVNLQTLVPSLTCEKMALAMEEAFAKVYGFTPNNLTLSTEAQAQIAEYEKELSSWDWLYGTRLPCSFSCQERFDWGSLELQLQVKSGEISGVQVYSDAMDWFLPEQLTEALTGCRFDIGSMCAGITSILGDTSVANDICQMLKKQDI